MTLKPITSESLALQALNSISDELAKKGETNVSQDEKGKEQDNEQVSMTMLEAWKSLPATIRAALISSETINTTVTSTISSSSISSFSGVGNKSNVKGDNEHVQDDDTGDTNFLFQPLDRAPNNVFSFTSKKRKESMKEYSGTPTPPIVVAPGKGWRNVFTLPISYDVHVVPRGSLLDSSNLQLLHATGVHCKSYSRRFAVIDREVNDIYGDQIHQYFTKHGIELTTCILSGGEAEKRPEAVDKLLDELCVYKLRRREPFLAIGGGVLLDIAGMGACMYRRGVPFVRVPTTLLAIVDASVGVKNGVDYCCNTTNETYKNRVGSFYAPSSCLLDASFIETQDTRNIANGFGEIMKLALVRSYSLFELIESNGDELINCKFSKSSSTPPGVANRIIELSIQIMLEELGPNLWEKKLERCVDYGHTFSKLLEMVPGADIMHGEAVNIDGFFCVILSFLRGYISMEIVQRVFKCMQSLSLPTNSKFLEPNLAWQSCKDAVEHRHGEQRIPLIVGIGESICVNDISEDELARAIDVMTQFPHFD